MYIYANGSGGGVMKEYFVVVIVIIFVGGIIVSLAPEGAGQRYLRLLVSLSVMGCIIMPLFSFFDGNQIDASGLYDMLTWRDENVQNYDEIYNNTILKAGVAEAENALKNDVIKELNGDYEDIDIRIFAKEKSGEIYIERAEIIIYPSGLSLDPHFIENYISQRLKCECTVVYKSDK